MVCAEIWASIFLALFFIGPVLLMAIVARKSKQQVLLIVISIVLGYVGLFVGAVYLLLARMFKKEDASNS